jgi:hypothetical protein
MSALRAHRETLTHCLAARLRLAPSIPDHLDRVRPSMSSPAGRCVLACRPATVAIVPRRQIAVAALGRLRSGLRRPLRSHSEQKTGALMLFPALDLTPPERQSVPACRDWKRRDGKRAKSGGEFHTCRFAAGAAFVTKPVGGLLASSGPALNVRRLATSLQRRLSGSIETDAEGFARPGYNATGGASGAMRRRDFHEWDTNETLPTALISQAIKIL